MEGPDEDGGGDVVGDVTVLPTIDTGSVVYLKDDMSARELIWDGEKREDEGDNLKGSGFTTVGTAEAIGCVEDERGRPGDTGVEHDVAGSVETDGSTATITVTAVGDTATSDPGEASAGGVRVEDDSRERRTSRAGRDGESFDCCEDGGSKDA